MKLTQHKRELLKKKIQVGASLTPHQAGKVTSAVLNVLGIQNIDKYSDTFAEDTCSKEIIRGEIKGRTPEMCAQDCAGPSGKHPGDMSCDECSAFKPTGMGVGSSRTPDMCAKECIGPLCTGCPAFEPIYVPRVFGPERAMGTLDKASKFIRQAIKDGKDEVLRVDMKSVHDPLPGSDALLEGYTKMASRSIDVEPPFELEEEVPVDNDGLMEIKVHVDSIVLTPKEFSLIRHPLQSAIKSSTNEKMYSLRKHGDNPEYLQEAMEDILIISKLSSRLDKVDIERIKLK